MKKDKIVISFDEKGHKVVVINEILFWGKKSIPWGKVEDYLKRYIGEIVKVAEMIFRTSLRAQRIRKESEEQMRRQKQILYREFLR